jgi:hypothetical protein
MRVFSHNFFRRARLLGRLLLAAACSTLPVPSWAQNDLSLRNALSLADAKLLHCDGKIGSAKELKPGTAATVY